MITVLGASGFIGSHLVKRLKAKELEFFAPGRDAELSDKELGDIIFCIGLTADFRSKPFETVDAHVFKLLKFLQQTKFNSLLYLSSSRVYEGRSGIAREEDPLEIAPLNPSNIYNISKAMGESLAFACGKNVRVARLSNVYGNDFTSQNFLPSIIKDAVLEKKVVLRTSPDSEKDYISIHDAVDALIKIATSGSNNIYNVASGVNVSNQQLLDRISELTGCEVEFTAGAPKISFPPISIERLRQEFGFQAEGVLENVDGLVYSYRRHHTSTPVSSPPPTYQKQEFKRSHGPGLKKILVTGASGFIGRHCLPFLQARGYEVHAVSSKATETEGSASLTWHKADLLDANQVTRILAEVEPSHLLHLAWYGVPRKYWTSTENFRWVTASLNLLQSFTRNGGERIVVGGTCAEYDWHNSHCSEYTTNLLPATVYGASKHALYMILNAYAREHKLSAAWGRLFFIYGPHEYPDRLIPSVIGSLLQNEAVPCSYGNQQRDFLYVADAAAALVSLLDSEVTGPVNIASGQAVALKTIVCKIAEKLGLADSVVLDAIPAAAGNPPLLVANVERLQKEVGWVPQLGLDRGLDLTIEWWKQYLQEQSAVS